MNLFCFLPANVGMERRHLQMLSISFLVSPVFPPPLLLESNNVIGLFCSEMCLKKQIVHATFLEVIATWVFYLILLLFTISDRYISY